MGCCHARDESTKAALYGKDSATPRDDKEKQDLDETLGIEFPLNTSGALDEEENEIEKMRHKEGVAFSTNTIEVSDTGSNNQQAAFAYVEYQEDPSAVSEGIPFAVVNAEEPDEQYVTSHTKSMPVIEFGRESFISSNSNYDGPDQVEFFSKVHAFLLRRAD